MACLQRKRLKANLPKFPPICVRLLVSAHGQIENKKYAERYKTTCKTLTVLAIACSAREVKCDIRGI
jgi:hypothetical protein